MNQQIPIKPELFQIRRSVWPDNESPVRQFLKDEKSELMIELCHWDSETAQFMQIYIQIQSDA